jgi:putative hydrolase of the HAD superfamily
MGYDDLISQYMTPLSPLPTPIAAGGRLAQPIQAVLFDIYGTLFISAAGDISIAQKSSHAVQKLDRLLRKFDIHKTPQDLVQELFRTIEDEHRRLRDKGIDYPEIVIDQIWMRILENDDIRLVRQFAIEYELIVNPVYPMPNLEKTLAVCRQQNLAMGIISNAQFFTPLLFEWFLNASPNQLGFHSELIFLSYQMQHAKPSMLPFKKAAAALNAMGFRTAAAVYVGNDMRNDVYLAKQLGFQTALFAGDARSLRLRGDDPQCRDLTPDLVLTDLSQLIDYL